MKGKRVQHNNNVLTLRQVVANLMENGKYQEALKKIQSRLMFGLKDAELAAEAARCCRRLSKQDEAQRYYNLALSIAPHNAGALNGLGLIHYERGNDAEAERCYQKALSIISDYPACRNNYGGLLHKMDRFDEAEAQYEAALASEPDYDDARYGIAFVYGQTQKLEQAIAHLRYIFDRNPQDTRCTMLLGMALMQRGQYKEGWAHYRGRYCADNPYKFVNLPTFSQPYWQGEDLRGKAIMVHREQGLGDEIQFSRYVSRLKAEKGAAQVYLVCTKNSIPLLQQLPDIDGVIAHEKGNKIPLFDYWIMLLDLPLHFCDSEAPFALMPPYFHACEDDIRRWPLPAGKTLRVGLVWKGSTAHGKDRFRSLPHLETLRPLFSVPGIEWISLQKGAGEDEALNPPEGMSLLALGHKVQDYTDTAAIIAQLDLVITVDTSVAHLTGAMDKPCWTLLSAFCTDWRWTEGQDTTHWYPSMRLWRGDTDGNWQPVILRMRDALLERVK